MKPVLLGIFGVIVILAACDAGQLTGDLTRAQAAKLVGDKLAATPKALEALTVAPVEGCFVHPRSTSIFVDGRQVTEMEALLWKDNWLNAATDPQRIHFLPRGRDSKEMAAAIRRQLLDALLALFPATTGPDAATVPTACKLAQEEMMKNFIARGQMGNWQMVHYQATLSERARTAGVTEGSRVELSRLQLREITGLLKDRPGPHMLTAECVLEWVPTERGKRLGLTPGGRRSDGAAIFQNYDDGWRLRRLSYGFEVLSEAH